MRLETLRQAAGAFLRPTGQKHAGRMAYDFVLVEALGRIDFLKMVNKYRVGEHEKFRELHHVTGK